MLNLFLGNLMYAFGIIVVLIISFQGPLPPGAIPVTMDVTASYHSTPMEKVWRGIYQQSTLWGWGSLSSLWIPLNVLWQGGYGPMGGKGGRFFLRE